MAKKEILVCDFCGDEYEDAVAIKSPLEGYRDVTLHGRPVPCASADLLGALAMGDAPHGEPLPLDLCETCLQPIATAVGKSYRAAQKYYEEE